jgi:hypothetical protein
MPNHQNETRTQAGNDTQDAKVFRPQPAPMPEAKKYRITTSEEVEIPQASPGKHFCIKLEKFTDVIEIRGENNLPNGTRVSIGKPWRMGGVAEAGKSFNFPTADHYLAKLVSGGQSSTFDWSEH